MATRGWRKARVLENGVRLPVARRSKYGAVKTTVNDITFHSKAEARRYSELLILARMGRISRLQLQPVYRLFARPLGYDEVEVGKYIGDFQYLDEHGLTVVEDVKGFLTPLYKFKKKFVEATYGITIREVR